MKLKIFSIKQNSQEEPELIHIISRYAKLATDLGVDFSDIAPVYIFDKDSDLNDVYGLLAPLHIKGYNTSLMQRHYYSAIEPSTAYAVIYSMSLVDDRYCSRSPVYVLGSSTIAYCTNLIDLRNTPQYVSGNYIVNGCPQLKSLHGIAKKLNSILLGYLDSLETLEHFPVIHSEGTISISSCAILKSLEGITNTARRVLISDLSSLENINHFPKQARDIAIENCKKLSSLEGIPENIEQDLVLRNLPSLKDISHFPKSIKGKLAISRCGELSKLSKKDIMNMCNISKEQLMSIE